MASSHDAFEAFRRGEYGRALAMYRQLANEGDVAAQVSVATMLVSGYGAPADLDQAEAALHRPVALGMPRALLIKAQIRQRRGDHLAYAAHLSEAAKMGSLPALVRLAECYRHGIGVEVNHRRSDELLAQAVARGHLRAKIRASRRRVTRPSSPREVLEGAVVLCISVVQSLVLAFRNPWDERIE